jgi:hypothetical protein
MKQTKAYILATSPTVAFVMHPLDRGRWLKTDASVVLVPCPQCKSVPGLPCVSAQGYGATTHYVRRNELKAQVKAGKFLKEIRVPTFVIQPEMAHLLQAIFGTDD